MYRINKSLKEFNNEFLKSNKIKEKEIAELCNRDIKVAFVEVTIIYKNEDMPRSIIFINVDGVLKGFKVPLQMFFTYKHTLDEFIEEIDIYKGYIYFKNIDKHGYMEKYYGDTLDKTNNKNDKYNNSLDNQISMFDTIQ